MVAETPTDGRCNARVVDKVGLTVECEPPDSDEDDEEPSLVLTDQHFDIARLVGPDGGIVDADANYESVRKFLWDDYELSHVGVHDDSYGDDEGPVEGLRTIVSETPIEVLGDYEVDSPDTTVDITSEIEPVWFEVESVVEDVSNRTTDHQGFCERYEMNDHDRCYVHQGGGAPESNTNAMSHGIYAQRSSFYQALGEEDKQYIEALVDSWVETAPFGRDSAGMVDTLYRCAIDQLKAWRGNDEYVDEHGNIEGLVKEQEIFQDGEVHQIEDEQSVNMAYSRLTGDVRQELKDLNVLDSPESQQADAADSFAQKLSGLADE